MMRGLAQRELYPNVRRLLFVNPATIEKTGLSSKVHKGPHSASFG
jgi:hypothetical protein